MVGGDNLNFSERLVKLMANRHETNYRLAKVIGVHQTTVKNWKNGRKPQLEHAAALAAHYDCTVDELLEDASR